MKLQVLQTVLNSLRELASPLHCEVCSTYLSKRTRRMLYVCDACLDSLEAPPSPNELFNRLSRNFAQDDLSISSIFSLIAAEHSAPIMEVMYSLKYRGISRLGVDFGREIGETMKHLGNVNLDVIIPVPIHHARVRERGYNQAERIAFGISQVLSIPIEKDALVRSRYTLSQTKLSAIEREKNVVDVFRGGTAKSKIINKNVLLVDDVFTTGATLNSCATTLLELGAKKVDVATLAVAI
ncbi:MAG: ComF family protein [Bacteroidetes bacterium]|nr:ComF family protein [Bacteroidota bacterium]